MSQVTSQTPEESREKAKAPVVDALQAKREEQAKAGMSHASMNGGRPVSVDELSEAEVVGDEARSFPDTSPGSADVDSVEDVPLVDTPSSEKTTEDVDGGNNAEPGVGGSSTGEGAQVGEGEPRQNQVDENESRDASGDSPNVDGGSGDDSAEGNDEDENTSENQ